MTRPAAVRFMRSEATMAFPDGRLLAARYPDLFVLAPDGWSTLATDVPSGARPLTREDAEDWCERAGWAVAALDTVPGPLA